MELKLIYGKNGELKEEEKAILDRLFNEYSVKIDRKLEHIDYLELYIKEYGKEFSKKKKFSIHVRVIGPSFFEAEASDWDFKKCLHMTFIKLINEIEHRLHQSNQGDNLRKNQQRRSRKS